MIAPEGKIILIPLLLLLLAGTGIQTYYPTDGLKWINLVLVIFTLFSLYFFRDPPRIPLEYEGFLSPADGKVVQIINMEDFNGSLFYFKDLLIDVYDIRGRKVYNNDYKIIPLSYNKVHLSFLRKIAAGTYFLKIQIGQQEFLEKVIVSD